MFKGALDPYLRKMQILVCILQLLNSFLLAYLVFITSESVRYCTAAIVGFCMCIILYTFSGVSTFLACVTEIPSYVELAYMFTLVSGLAVPGAIYNHVMTMETILMPPSDIVKYLIFFTMYNVLASYLYHRKISADAENKTDETLII